MNDNEILQLLENTPEQGIEKLFTEYSGLLWSVAAAHLTQTEDIRECVNDAFTEFYWQRAQFDMAKGSLKGYLAVIVRRLAIKKYWDNAHQPILTEDGETISCGEDPISRFEDREELDAYLRSLDPLDEQIVRMKYYNGMTAREIATELDIPYETVKKRHQRSLKKLLRAMTMGLILILLGALLAGCAWFILRYFGIVPGYGINRDPELPVYILEEPFTVETEGSTLTCDFAYWKDGQMILDGTMDFGSEEQRAKKLDGYSASRPKVKGVEPRFIQGQMIAEDGRAIDMTQGAAVVEKVRYIYYCDLPEDFDKKSDTLPLTLCWRDGVESEIVLHRAETEVSFEKAGYYEMTEDEGGLLALPRIENGNLIVAIYPLSDGDYVIQPSLSHGIWMSTAAGYEITATAEDGTVLVGNAEGYSPFSGYEFYEWNFGPAQPGKYTLHVPYVYQLLRDDLQQGEIVERIWLDNDGGTLDLQMELPDATLTLTDYVVSDHREEVPILDEDTKILRHLYEQTIWWDADFKIENANPERSLIWWMPIAKRLDTLIAEEFTPAGKSVSINSSSVDLIREPTVDPETGEDYLETTGARFYIVGGENELELTLRFGSLAYRWDHPFTIEFEVEAE